MSDRFLPCGHRPGYCPVNVKLRLANGCDRYRDIQLDDELEQIIRDAVNDEELR